MRAGLFISAIFWGLVAVYLTGCGSTAGWEVRFGVTPINGVNNQNRLEQRNQLPGKGY